MLFRYKGTYKFSEKAYVKAHLNRSLPVIHFYYQDL